jgi:hypothetical protein
VFTGAGLGQQQNRHITLRELIDNGFDRPHAGADALNKGHCQSQGCPFPVVIYRFRQSFPHFYAHRLLATLPESVEVAC